MKIFNATDYSTRDLRRLFLAGLKAGGAGPKEIAEKQVYVNPSRCLTHGEGTIGSRRDIGSYIAVWLPAPKYFILKRVAQVFAHELDHNRGLTHGEMAEWWDLDVSWCDGMTIGFKGEARIAASKRRRK